MWCPWVNGALLAYEVKDSESPDPLVGLPVLSIYVCEFSLNSGILFPSLFLSIK